MTSTPGNTRINPGYSATRLWLSLVLLVAATLLLGWLVYRWFTAQSLAQIDTTLSTIAASRAEAVGRWRRDLLEDLKAGQAEIALLNTGHDPQDAFTEEQLERLRAWLDLQRDAHGYAQVLLLSSTLDPVLSSPPGQYGLDPDRAAVARAVLDAGHARLTSIHAHEADETRKAPADSDADAPLMHIGAMVPLFAQDDALRERAYGLLVIRISPMQSVNPFVEDWPAPALPGGFALIEQNADEARIIAQGGEGDRSSAGPARPNEPSARAAALVGAVTPMRVTLDQGEVRAVTRPVADSDWAVSAMLPQSIIALGNRQTAFAVLLFCGLTILLAAAATTSLWHRQRGRRDRAYLTRERELVSQLARERAKFRNLFDSVDDIIYVADPDTYELLFVNAYFRKIIHPDPVGNKCYAVLQNRDAPCPFCTNDKIFGEYRNRTYVWEFQNEVTKRWYRCADKAIEWTDGRLVRYELASDITDERAMDQQRIQLEKLGALGQLTAGVAHELNNPLMGVINAVQYCIGLTKSDDPRAEVLTNAERYVRRCIDIVAGLLAFSHSGQDSADFAQVDPRREVQSTLQLLQYRLDKQGIQVEVEADDDIGCVDLQAARFGQVLLNLLTNAMDAVAESEEKRIRVSLTRTDDNLVVEVSDSGCGIPETQLQRIFEPFYTTKPVGKGTGLGLSTSWSIIHDHGGSMDIESEPGDGTRMLIEIPLTQDRGDASEPAAEGAGATVEATPL